LRAQDPSPEPTRRSRPHVEVAPAHARRRSSCSATSRPAGRRGRWRELLAWCRRAGRGRAWGHVRSIGSPTGEQPPQPPRGRHVKARERHLRTSSNRTTRHPVREPRHDSKDSSLRAERLHPFEVISPAAVTTSNSGQASRRGPSVVSKPHRPASRSPRRRSPTKTARTGSRPGRSRRLRLEHNAEALANALSRRCSRTQALEAPG